MRKTKLFAANGRMVFAWIDEERAVVCLSMRQISYLLAGLCGDEHAFHIGNPTGPCVRIAGYDGGYSEFVHAFRIEEEDNGFKWIMIPGMRRPRRKARA